MHFQRFPTLCRNPIGCTELYCSDALGSDAVEWLGSAALKWLRTCLGCCNRMLPKLNDIHLAACIADSTFGLTPPPHEAAVAKCDFLNPNTQSMHFQSFPTLCAQILSGARSFAARMHWGRMQSNGFGRLHSNGCGHDWAIATNVTKIR